MANDRRDEILHVNKIGDVAADSDTIKHAVLYGTSRFRITKARAATSVNAPAQDTHYQKVRLMNGATELCNWETGPAASGDSFTAGVWISKDPPPNDDVITEDDTLTIQFQKTGNGMALSGLVIQIDGEIWPPRSS